MEASECQDIEVSSEVSHIKALKSGMVLCTDYVEKANSNILLGKASPLQ